MLNMNGDVNKGDGPMMQKIMVLTIGLFLLCACSTPEDGAPFIWHFKMVTDDQFQYVARGNVDFPANTKSGEQARIKFLNNYLQQNGICPNGYEILSREPEHLFGRSSLDKQRYRMVTYVGQCHKKLAPE